MIDDLIIDRRIGSLDHRINSGPSMHLRTGAFEQSRKQMIRWWFN